MNMLRDEMPLVSIVMPTFNRAHMLPGAIESCLAQTWQNIELIIVDDGSKDNTATVVAEWAGRDQRVQYVYQENGKIPRALNTGFHLAMGQFFTWTSDDNLLEPAMVETLVTYLLSNPEVGIVYADCQIIDEQGQLQPTAKREEPDDLFDHNMIGACFMYTRQIAESVGDYDESLYLAEDYDYWMRIGRVAPVRHLAGVPHYRFRVHPDSLTSTREADALLAAMNARLKHAGSRSEERRIRCEGYFRAAVALRTAGDFRRSLAYSVAAFRYQPFYTPAHRNMLACMLRHKPRMNEAREGIS